MTKPPTRAAPLLPLAPIFTAMFNVETNETKSSIPSLLPTCFSSSATADL